MRCSKSLDLLGLPFTVAKTRLHSMGYNIERVKYTLSPKEQEVEAPRVVRQNTINDKNIELVLANSPWVFCR